MDVTSIIRKLDEYASQDRCIYRLAYILHHLGHESVIVRRHTVWALSQFELTPFLLDRLLRMRDAESNEGVLELVNKLLESIDV